MKEFYPIYIWQEKSRKIWHFTFFLEGNIGQINYSIWISKTERGSTVSSKRFDETLHKNVGVYVENVCKTIFQLPMKKRGRIFRYVLL